MTKFLERKISYLKGLKQKNTTNTTTKATKKRLDEIITLYADRKISNITTAENLIKGLTSSNKKIYDKAFQKYKDNIKEFKEKKPLNERLKEAKDKTYFISFLLYYSRTKV